MRSIAIVLHRAADGAVPASLCPGGRPLRAVLASALPLEQMLAGAERYFVLDSAVGNVALRLCFPASAPQLLSDSDIAASFQQYLETFPSTFAVADFSLPAYVLCSEDTGAALSDAAISAEVLEIACRGAMSALFFARGGNLSLLCDPRYPVSDAAEELPEGICEYTSLGDSETDFALQQSVRALLKRLRRNAGEHPRSSAGTVLLDFTEPF